MTDFNWIFPLLPNLEKALSMTNRAADTWQEQTDRFIALPEGPCWAHSCGCCIIGRWPETVVKVDLTDEWTTPSMHRQPSLVLGFRCPVTGYRWTMGYNLAGWMGVSR